MPKALGVKLYFHPKYLENYWANEVGAYGSRKITNITTKDLESSHRESYLLCVFVHCSCCGCL